MPEYVEMVSTQCKNCDADITVTARSFKEAKAGNFCSRECVNKYYSAPKLIKTCQCCGKEFEITESRLRLRKSRSKNGNIYCSSSCSNKHNGIKRSSKKPSDTQLLSEKENATYSELGKKYGVTAHCVYIWVRAAKNRAINP